MWHTVHIYLINIFIMNEGNLNILFAKWGILFFCGHLGFFCLYFLFLIQWILLYYAIYNYQLFLDAKAPLWESIYLSIQTPPPQSFPFHLLAMPYYSCPEKTGVILHTSLSLNPHLQSNSKSCWPYFRHISRIWSVFTNDTLSIWMQASITSFLDGCNNLLTGFLTSTPAPFCS